MAKSKRNLVPLAVPLIIVITLLVGFFVGMMSFSNSKVTTLDETADWKTYSNTRGYSIRYPMQFAFQTISADVGNGNEDTSARNVYIYPLGVEEPYLERYINLESFQIKPVYQNGKIEKVTLDGRLVEKITIPDSKFDIYESYLSDDSYIEIYVSNNPTKKALANKILETFKFVGNN